VSVLWADSKRTVSGQSAYQEQTVSVPWANCEWIVSVPRAECERIAIGKVSVQRADCERTMSGQCENCERTVSVPTADCDRTVSLLWGDSQRTDSGMWAYRNRKSECTESGLRTYREFTVSSLWACPYRSPTQFLSIQSTSPCTVHSVHKSTRMTLNGTVEPCDELRYNKSTPLPTSSNVCHMCKQFATRAFGIHSRVKTAWKYNFLCYSISKQTRLFFSLTLAHNIS